MVTMTLAVPSELRHKMESHPEINWSEVARQAFLAKVSDLDFLEKFKAESEMTEEDALDLGRELKKSLMRKYKESK